jgi:hypothetical protein
MRRLSWPGHAAGRGSALVRMQQQQQQQQQRSIIVFCGKPM